MVRDDDNELEAEQVTVKIGDQEVEGEISGMDMVQDNIPVEDPEEHGDKYRRETRVQFSLEIEELSQELKNWLIWGEPDPEIQSTQVLEEPSEDEIREVDVPASVGFFPKYADEYDADIFQEKIGKMEFRKKLRDNRDVVLDIVEEEYGPSQEEDVVGSELADKILRQVKHFNELHDGDDLSTNEVADKIGEPVDKTEQYLETLRMQGVLDSYPIGNTYFWKVPEKEDES